ncbi:MAG: HEAT repeat domain-containing protein [Anaerolineae bacterium]|nr:MAG: HEAT repeat domain-containing protein [Anaerolineae bacterium]
MPSEFKYESTHYPQLNQMTLPELMAHFRAEHLDEEGDEDWWQYEDTALLIRKLGSKAGIDFLLEMFNSTQSIARKRAILLAVTFRPDLDTPEIFDLLVKSLDAEEHVIIMDAIDGLRHLKKFDLLDRVMAFRNHPSPYVRGGVFRYISGLFPVQAIPILIEGIRDPHPIPRGVAADMMSELELDEIELHQFLPYLQSLRNDEDDDVRETARISMAIIEGTEW